MPPSPDAAEVLCLGFLNQIIKPTPTTATADTTITIAIEALVAILSSPERGPGGGSTLSVGLALGVGLTLGLGPERNKQAYSICSDVYTRWGSRAALS